MVCRKSSMGLMSHPRGLRRGSGRRICRADAIRSIDLSLRVCQGLAADFRRRSAFSSAALWGRKAGTDRVREGIPEGFCPTEQALRALKARKRQALSHPTYLSFPFLSSHRAHTISRLCAYAATRVRLAKARGMSLRSDGETVSNGLSVYPTCCATQSVGICSMAIL